MLVALIKRKNILSMGAFWVLLSCLASAVIALVRAPEGMQDHEFHYTTCVLMSSVLFFFCCLTLLVFIARNIYQSTARNVVVNLLLITMASSIVSFVIAISVGWLREFQGALDGAFDKLDMPSNIDGITHFEVGTLILVLPVLIFAMCVIETFREWVLKRNVPKEDRKNVDKMMSLQNEVSSVNDELTKENKKIDKIMKELNSLEQQLDAIPEEKRDGQKAKKIQAKIADQESIRKDVDKNIKALSDENLRLHEELNGLKGALKEVLGKLGLSEEIKSMTFTLSTARCLVTVINEKSRQAKDMVEASIPEYENEEDTTILEEARREYREDFDAREDELLQEISSLRSELENLRNMDNEHVSELSVLKKKYKKLLESRTDGSTGERKVLFVDGDMNDVAQFAEELRGTGFISIEIAMSAGDAIKVMRDKKWFPDVIMLNNKLPDISAVQFVAALERNQRLKRIPVILCSSSPKNHILHELERISPAAFLQKPCTPVVMKKAVFSVLGIVEQKKKANAE